MTEERKPRVFIASSVENLETAYAIQENLEFSAEVTVWSQGVFKLTRSTLSTLLEQIGYFDFAIFVFAPDDILKIRDKEENVIRDNVLFELGLFMGELGEERVFVVIPRGVDLHLPTDLIGITPATYEPNRSDNNLIAALGPTCTKLNRAMSQTGIRKSISSDGIPESVTSGLADELKLRVTEMMHSQEQKFADMMETYESRLNKINKSQINSSTSKSTSTRNTIEKLSTIARGILISIRGRHITTEQYHKLLTSKLDPYLDELRANNLLTPLSSRGNILVYWFPPGISKIALSILENEYEFDEKELSMINEELKKAGYSG